jgi:SAM-dependent methyltransferase
MENNFGYAYLSYIYDDCKSFFWGNYLKVLHPILKDSPKSVLDLGCGTGLAIKYLHCDVENYIGVDISTHMLDIARTKYPTYKFSLESILNVNFPQQFYLVLAAFDTLNHFLRPEDWKKVFYIATRHMSKDSFFVFDVVTPYDHEINWPGQVNVTDSENWLYLQRSEYDRENKKGILMSTIFQKENEGWKRYDETIEQISLPVNEILNMLFEVGLECHQTIDLTNGGNVTYSSETILFVCKKLSS